MVDWLTQYPTVTDQIEAIANVLGKEVVKELDRSFIDHLTPPIATHAAATWRIMSVR